MAGSSAITRRTSSRRTASISGLRGPVANNESANPRAISAEMAREFLSQPTPRAAQIGSDEHDAGGKDANADLAGADDREHECLAVRAPDGAEFVARDDRRGDPGERRGIGGEVSQQRGHKRARRAPESQTEEKTHTLLRKARGQRHDRHGPDHRADHAEPCLAQRSAEARQTDDGRRCAGPVRIVEFEPERDVHREADRGPQAQTEQERRRHGPQPIRQIADIRRNSRLGHINRLADADPSR